MTARKGIQHLLAIADRLLGPKGCPWDQKQTLFSLQAYLLEETHELIEAIDTQEPSQMKEEAADLLWALIFVAKLAEKKKFFSFYDLIEESSVKLIRRHPHIFGDQKAKDAEEVMDIWQTAKNKEKRRDSALSGIPPSLPLIARTQKIIGRIKKNAPAILGKKKEKPFASEKELGEALIDVLSRAEKSHFPCEDILRRKLKELEKSFSKWEKKNRSSFPV